MWPITPPDFYLEADGKAKLHDARFKNSGARYAGSSGRRLARVRVIRTGREVIRRDWLGRSNAGDVVVIEDVICFEQERRLYTIKQLGEGACIACIKLIDAR